VSADKFPDTVDKRVPECTRALQMTIHTLNGETEIQKSIVGFHCSFWGWKTKT